MKKLFTLAVTASLMFSCTQEEVTPNFEKNPINISMGMEAQSRANDATYEDGDEIGLYVVNYDGSTAGTLKDQENQVDNMRFTYNSGTWNPDESIFWKDKNTATDFYAYYPYSESVNISAHPFSVNADQSTEENFWASDFLWGKTSNVLPTPLAVPIKTKHSFSRILVEIKAGKGFTDETWANATKSIKIYSVQTSATIDLSTGVATATGDKGETTPLNTAENNYQAMIVPQVVEDASRLVVATVDGTDYVYRKGYEFKANTQHKFTITVNKTDGSVNITIGEWDIDEADNNGEATNEVIPNNQIWYTSTDEKVVEPNEDAVFGANIVSNIYEDNKGVITFDGDVKRIEGVAFNNCHNLESIHIPNTVSSINQTNPFGNCSNLTAFYGKFASADNKVLIVNNELISYTMGRSDISYTIPDNVTTIATDAFYGSQNLNNVIVSDNVTTIAICAFYGCPNLSAFYGKFASEDNRCLVVDGTLIAFAPFGLNSYEISNEVTEIGYAAFKGIDNLQTIGIPNSIKAIRGQAFHGCHNLLNVDIPESVTTIEQEAFTYCPNLTTFYGKYASEDNKALIVNGVLNSFAYGCGDTYYTIPNGVTEVGATAFYANGNITDITIPQNVTTIGHAAFSGCGNLANVVISENVTSISSYAFKSCSNLTSVVCKPTNPPAGNEEMFKEIATSAKIYVPIGSGEAYKTADYWKDYAEMIEELEM